MPRNELTHGPHDSDQAIMHCQSPAPQPSHVARACMVSNPETHAKKKSREQKAQSGTFLPKARFCAGMPAERLAFVCEQPLARCCCRQAWAVIAYTELSCDSTHLVNLGSAAMSRQRVGPFFSDVCRKSENEMKNKQGPPFQCTTYLCVAVFISKRASGSS